METYFITTPKFKKRKIYLRFRVSEFPMCCGISAIGRLKTVKLDCGMPRLVGVLKSSMVQLLDELTYLLLSGDEDYVRENLYKFDTLGLSKLCDYIDIDDYEEMRSNILNVGMFTCTDIMHPTNETMSYMWNYVKHKGDKSEWVTRSEFWNPKTEKNVKLFVLKRDDK